MNKLLENEDFLKEVINFRLQNSLKDTIKKFKISRYQIIEIFLKAKIDQPKRITIPRNIVDQIIDCFKETKSVEQTAKKLKVSKDTVRKYCKINNITTSFKTPKRKPRPNLTPEQQELFDQHYETVKAIISAKGASWRASLSGLEYADILQAGLIALWRCCLTYDSTTGNSFSTLLGKAVVGEMYEVIEIARYGRRARNKPLIDHSQFKQYIEDIDKE